MTRLSDPVKPTEVAFPDQPTRRTVARYLFTGIWFLYLIGPLSVLFTGHHHPALWVAGGIAIAVAYCTLFLVLVTASATGRWPALSWPAHACYGALFLLALLGCVVYGAQWVTLWIFMSSATGWVFPIRAPVLRALAAVTAFYSLSCWFTHSGADVFVADLLPVAFVGLAMSGFRYQVRLVHELSEARETVAKLAASEERLRLARDMHDLTGQSLSMITLKSDLLRKLLSRLPASAERDQALTEAADIGQVSRQTLHDIREAVSGYRRPTLAVEIITARGALEAAGIDLDDDPGLTLRSGTFDGDAEAALAWCLREAVTNVIRHSGARHCRVRLIERGGELTLTVSDDGHGLNGLASDDLPGPGAVPAGTVPAGTVPAGTVPAGTVPAGMIPASAVPANSASVGSVPVGSVRASAVPAGTVPAGAVPAGAIPVGSVPAGGSGLHGMSERLTALGGRLSFGHARGFGRGERGLRISATVPLPAGPGQQASPDAASCPGSWAPPPTVRVPATPE